jgi:hypothetical protein
VSNLREALRLLPLHGVEVRHVAGPDALPGLPGAAFLVWNLARPELQLFAHDSAAVEVVARCVSTLVSADLPCSPNPLAA